MTTISTDIRPCTTATSSPKSASGGKRSARSRRVEAGVILGAFGLALAFFSHQQNTEAAAWSWSPVQTAAVNQELSTGAWLPLGEAADISDGAIYQFCVTTQGAGTMMMEPLALMGAVTLAGGAPVTTCADTHGVPAVEALHPQVTTADPASEITVIEASWQRLETQSS